MTNCATCGTPTNGIPALCVECRRERAVHGAAKAKSRHAALVRRVEGEDATSLVEASEALRAMAAVAPQIEWLQRFAAAVDDAAHAAVDEEFDGLASDRTGLA